MTSEWENNFLFKKKMLEVYLYNFWPKILEKTESIPSPKS